MARGFGSTLGSGTTDVIQTALTTDSTLRSYGIWTYRNGLGGSNVGRAFSQGNETASLSVGASSSYRFIRTWTGDDGQWSIAFPAGSEWHHIGISYDSGATTNDPLMYVDGVSVTVTQIGTDPTGSASTNSNPMLIGNRADGLRNWDGSLAELSVWNVILTDDEWAAVGKGVSSMSVRPMSLIEYVPDDRSYWAGAVTITGTAIQPHPRVYYPAKRRIFLPTTVIGRSNLVGGKLTKSLLFGGLAR